MITKTEDQIVKELRHNYGITVDRRAHRIKVCMTRNSLGNKSWGKIDYLRKTHGYRLTKTL